LGGVMVPEIAQFVPCHELAGLPTAVSRAKGPPVLEADANETSGTLIVGVNVGAPAVPKSQVTMVVLGVHEEGGAGLEVTTRVSVAKLPVSIDVLMNKLPEVLL
jgi:hypothetical protein